MSSIRPYPLSNNQSSWMSNIGNTVNGHNLTAGNGISLVKSPHGGVQISVTDTTKPNYVRNRGMYDFNAEYWPNDMISVDTTSSYLDQGGNLLTSLIIPLVPGGYVCTTYIPPASNDSASFITNVVPAYQTAGGYPTDTIANTFRWYGLNVYYPNTTITNNGSVSVVNTSGFNILVSQSFWQPIGGVGGSGIQYKGEYNDSASYYFGNIVRKQSGPSQGVWICVATSSVIGVPPLFPEPVSYGGVNTWDMFTFGVQVQNSCPSGFIYMNSSL